jgi:hypothetical protein
MPRHGTSEIDRDAAAVAVLTPLIFIHQHQTLSRSSLRFFKIGLAIPKIYSRVLI